MTVHKPKANVVIQPLLNKNQRPIRASWVGNENELWLKYQMLAFPFICPIHASVFFHAPHFHHYLHHWENPLVVHLTHLMLCMSQTQMWGRLSPLPWFCIRGSQHILFDNTSKELAGVTMFYHN